MEDDGSHPPYYKEYFNCMRNTTKFYKFWKKNKMFNKEQKMNQIYVGWLAYRFDQEKEFIESKEYGPTLTFFLDNESDFAGSEFQKIYILKQADEKSRKIYSYLTDTLKRERKLSDQIFGIVNEYEGNPTDYNAIQEYLEMSFKQIAEENKNIDELIIHISPGTPVMQTLWCLVTASGILKTFFSRKTEIKLIKTIRKIDRQKNNSNRAAMEVRLRFDSFYQSYQKMKSGNVLDKQKEKTEDKAYWKIDPDKYKSPLMKDLIEKIQMIAQVKAPLLILGERGVGKTTFAQWIRSVDPNIADKKKQNPLLALSCGVYTSDLLRSELCGYKKGAFTGAIQDKDGLFKKADEDILFLDEIGDCSLEMQGVIIRTIEEKKFLPVGAEKDEESDFRLICATNLPFNILSEKIRTDFLDRISLLTITIPALREIRVDLPLIWDQVWEISVQKGFPQDPNIVLSDSWRTKLLELLNKEELPGNIRDLQKIAYKILTYWIQAENRRSCEPAQVIDEALHDWKNISGPKKKLSCFFPGDEIIDIKEYENMLEGDFINEVENRKKDGKKLKEITNLEIRTYNNRKNKYLNRNEED